MTEKKISKYSDIYPTAEVWDEERVKFADLIDKELVVYEIREIVTENGQCLVVKAKVDDRMVQFLNSSQAIMPKLVKLKNDNHLPTRLTFVIRTAKKSDREYYDIE